jgi:hypothetical protein
MQSEGRHVKNSSGLFPASLYAGLFLRLEIQ